MVMRDTSRDHYQLDAQLIEKNAQAFAMVVSDFLAVITHMTQEHELTEESLNRWQDAKQRVYQSNRENKSTHNSVVESCMEHIFSGAAFYMSFLLDDGRELLQQKDDLCPGEVTEGLQRLRQIALTLDRYAAQVLLEAIILNPLHSSRLTWSPGHDARRQTGSHSMPRAAWSAERMQWSAGQDAGGQVGTQRLRSTSRPPW